MTHTVHHTVDHSDDQPPAAPRDVTTSAAADDPVLSPEEVSAMLGGVPQATLTRWRTERTGPVPIHVGRHVRYRRSAVEAWLEARDREAVTWMAM
jgi:predicted DNA-binding transcriptional regulator AlpA